MKINLTIEQILCIIGLCVSIYALGISIANKMEIDEILKNKRK